MDPFTNLPPEIIQQILSYTADFVGIESLLSASSWVQNVFRSQPRRITLNIIESHPITTMPEILKLLYNIAAINIDSYMMLCPNSPMDRWADCPTTAPPELGFGLPAQMTTQEIIHIIHIAANIQRLSCMCLYYMQQNFISAVDKSFGATAAQRAGEPIVWIEEYRVYWALWHFQHYSTLRNTAEYRWNWSEDSCKDLGTSYMIWNNINFGLGEQIWTVAGVLRDMGLRPLYGHSHEKQTANEKKNLEEDEEESSIAAWEFLADTPIPIPFFSSLDLKSCALLHSRQGEFDSTYPIWSPAPPPNDDCPLEIYWSRTSGHRLYRSNCGPMVRAYTSLLKTRPESRPFLRDMRQIKPFRRLGVMIWSRWRMYAVGLYPLCTPGKEMRTADGKPVRESYSRLSGYEVISRWLALVGKPLPDMGKNHDNSPSTVAANINTV